MDLLLPTLASVPEAVEMMGRLERLSATPATAGALLRMAFEGDVRSLLPVIQVPTLVLHCTGDRFVPVEHGSYLAEHIRGARLIELADENHLPVLDMARMADEVEAFLTGERPAPREIQRQLATVLFTDIVGSTQKATEIGDHRWSELLDGIDTSVARKVELFGGRLVKSTGDGHLATFDGPGRAIACAQAIHDGAVPFGVRFRIGLHTGEVESRADDIAGIAVHVAARVLAAADAGETLVSPVVPPLVLGSGIGFVDRGEHQLKGVPGDWHLFAVES